MSLTYIDIDARFCPAIFELEITRAAIYRSNLLVESGGGGGVLTRAHTHTHTRARALPSSRQIENFVSFGRYTPAPLSKNVAGSSRAFSRSAQIGP